LAEEVFSDEPADVQKNLLLEGFRCSTGLSWTFVLRL